MRLRETFWGRFMQWDFWVVPDLVGSETGNQDDESE